MPPVPPEIEFADVLPKVLVADVNVGALYGPLEVAPITRPWPDGDKEIAKRGLCKLAPQFPP